ncbi:MAG: FHA domain-containing protein [Planctomycetes bacterium]|nr:FHA domain-containing protein [Planctomycetota bacterium]
MAFVRCTPPGQPARVVSLINEVTVIGRSAEADISVPIDQNCSRKHCQIRKWAGKFILEDLQSHNGTFVNGEKVVKDRPLFDGDLISIGDTTVLFKNEKP